MQNFRSHCIFCSKSLSDVERKGEGDHIIPEFLYGSLCIKDVCTSCNSELGGSTDNLPLEDKRIISAVFALDLPELQAKIRDRGTGTLIDSTDKTQLSVRFKGGLPRVVPKKMSKELFVCDERENLTHLMNMLKKDPHIGIPDFEMQRIVQEQLLPKYDRLCPGDSVSEPILGVRLRKAPCEIVQNLKITDDACTKLVAKIGFEIATLVFEEERRVSLPILTELADIAKGRREFRESVLMYPPERFSPVNAPPFGPKRHHQIVVWYESYGNVIDIYFFGCVGFRLFLFSEAAEAVGPFRHTEGDIHMVSFLMSFDSNETGIQKKKYMFVKRMQCEKIEMYNGGNVL